MSAGKLRDLHADRLVDAEAELAGATEALRDDDEIRIDLPETWVPSGRMVLGCDAANIGTAAVSGGRSGPSLWRRDIDLAIRGPERVALIGANGVGKTTLLRLILGELQPTTGTVTTGVAGMGYLPQRLDLLDDGASLMANVRRFAPHASDNEVRARLARLSFRGHSVEQPAGTLSGGERFRALLAALLGAPPPQLLLLDEPTNNLDIASVRQLAQALDAGSLTGRRGRRTRRLAQPGVAVDRRGAADPAGAGQRTVG